MKKYFFALIVALCAACSGGTPEERAVARAVGDKEIEKAVMLAYHYDARFPEVKVVCRDGLVTLSGSVDTVEAHRDAVDIARRTAGVREVVSEITARER